MPVNLPAIGSRWITPNESWRKVVNIIGSGEIHYMNHSGKCRSCWITTWHEWVRANKAIAAPTAEGGWE